MFMSNCINPNSTVNLILYYHIYDNNQVFQKKFTTLSLFTYFYRELFDITILFYILSVLFLLNGVVMNIRTNATVGLFILYGLSICCFVFGRYHTQIITATNHGVLLWLRTLVIIGILVYIGLMGFIMAQSSTAVNYKEDVVIILGSGVKNGKVGKPLQLRLDAGIEYSHKNPDAYIVVTGGLTPQKDTTEAAVMKDYLVQHGIAEEKIIVEDKSLSTLENYRFSKELLEKYKIKHDSIVFITNDFHIYRAKTYAKFCGFDNAHPLSTRTDLFTITPALTREVLGVIDMWVFKLR